MPEIEFHQLQRPYGGLRIATAASRRRLLASLAADGQRTPVLVVEREPDRYVLIDGYQRVGALEKLGRDTVKAVVLPLGEAAALIFKHHQERSRRRSALEDAWLLRVLTEDHGLEQHEVARRLGHSPSWVCRRLGLVTVLPASVQELVRTGQLSAHSTMRHLLPLARANRAHCERLAAHLAGHELSTRQMEKLYVTWRASDDPARARLVEQPLLFLQAAEELQQPEPPQPDAALIKDVTVIGAVCRRVARRLCRRRAEPPLPAELGATWAGTHQSMDALAGLMKERLE
jgi:ParB/RepB/Spo0J family partition protein